MRYGMGQEIADVKEPEIWKDHFEEKTPDEQIETKQQSESQSKDQSESLTKKENPELINKPIYIYHTHNRESFRASDGKSSDYSAGGRTAAAWLCKRS